MKKLLFVSILLSINANAMNIIPRKQREGYIKIDNASTNTYQLKKGSFYLDHERQKLVVTSNGQDRTANVLTPLIINNKDNLSLLMDRMEQCGQDFSRICYQPNASKIFVTMANGNIGHIMIDDNHNIKAKLSGTGTRKIESSSSSSAESLTQPEDSFGDYSSEDF